MDNSDGTYDPRVTHPAVHLRQQKSITSSGHPTDKYIPGQPLNDNFVGSQDASGSKKRTSTTEGPKFRKKGISEYLAGFDNSGSNSNQNDELVKSGQNVKVAPRDMVLEFHPKDSVISEKITD